MNVLISDASAVFFQLPVFLPHAHTNQQLAQQGLRGFMCCADVNMQMNNSVFQMALLFNTQAY